MDPVLRDRLWKLANAPRRRFGYRRLFALFRREGEPSGINRIYGHYREEGMTRKGKARGKATGTRAPILVEARPTARRSMNFVRDQFANGQLFRVINVVDNVTRKRLAAIPDTSISGRRAAREPTALIEQRGTPGTIASDNGTELTGNAILRWCSDLGIEWHTE
ncbi:hypothetical protein GCM10011324_46290 [Allosediminivita pacifica]|nr:hypothetical protein GCM10011324_46290 [Allosediminivita pacifica]